METKKPIDDFTIIQRAIAGDQSAYTELMDRYKMSVYFVVLKMVHNNNDDAEDLTLEAFAKAFNKLEKYNPDYAFSTWLFKIAVNHAIDFNRKKKLKTLSIDHQMEGKENSFAPTYRSDELDPEEHFIKSQRLEAIKSLAEKLSPKYRELIQLRFFEELSYIEIAERIDMPIGTVKARLSRAKKLLKRILETNTSDDVDD